MTSLIYEKALLNTIVKAGIRPQGRRLRRRERALQRELNREFEKQKKFVIKKAKTLLNKKSLGDDIDNLFDELSDEMMIDSIIVASGSTMKMGADYRIAKSKLGEIGISFDLEHPEAVKYLNTDRPLVLAKMKDTTKEHIKPILLEAAKTGQSPQATAELIRENYAFSKTRSLMIATNEVGTAYEYGNLVPMTDAFQEGYDVTKSWLTAGDDRVTDECRMNEDMGWILLDEDFDSGDASAPRGDHPRCRCTTLYEYK